MSTNTAYNKKHCTIQHLPEINAIQIEWKGFSIAKDFQEACNSALDLMTKNKSSKLLVDNRNSKVVSQENQEWLANEWYEKAFKNGYRATAVIVSDNILNQMSIKNIEEKKSMLGLQSRHFSNTNEAISWLKSL